MGLDKIMSISGKPGLYELKAQTRTGVVVESLLDGKRITVGLRDNLSLLSEVAIYTYDGEVKLSEVLLKIAQHTNSQLAISHKDSKETLQSYLKEILPDYDEERVYPSDIKKLIQWYNILQSKEMVSEDFLAQEEKDSQEP